MLELGAMVGQVAHELLLQYCMRKGWFWLKGWLKAERKADAEETAAAYSFEKGRHS